MKFIGGKNPKAFASLLLGAITLASVSVAEPAKAFSWDEKSVTFGLSDVAAEGVKVFYFEGYTMGGGLVDGLTSELTLAIESWTSASNKTQVNLKGTVTNTMDSAVFTAGNVSGVAFNVDPDPKYSIGGFVAKAPLNVSLGQTSTFYKTLTWKGIVNEFTLTDFYAKYSGLHYADSASAGGAFGYGVGTVPTPALIPSLLGMALAARRGKKRQELVGQESEVSEQAA